MKPAIRLSAIQELPVKFIWTHDAFRVGEDGPTHQPVEQEAQIRLLEKLKNHKGNNSFVALRPADSAETVVAWKMLLENDKVPAGLILSRQGIKDIPATGKLRYHDALQAEKGGYLVQTTANADVTLIANGSEVSTLIEASKLLTEKKGLKVNIASIISEGLFRQQTQAYQDSVILKNKPVFGLTAGLPVNLEALAGPNGHVFGLEHFGYSAPANVLDEKFGFTGEKVFDQVVSFLGK
jgi:transketolase